MKLRTDSSLAQLTDDQQAQILPLAAGSRLLPNDQATGTASTGWLRHQNLPRLAAPLFRCQSRPTKNPAPGKRRHACGRKHQHTGARLRIQTGAPSLRLSALHLFAA